MTLLDYSVDMRDARITLLLATFLSVINDDLLKIFHSSTRRSNSYRGVMAKIFATQMGSSVVETQYGKLRGVLTTLTNRQLPQVETYLGMQYASLLGGELRFMPPTTAIEKWEGVRVALSFRPVCPQRVPTEEELEAVMPRWRIERINRMRSFLEQQNEDCLYLNLYVPVRNSVTGSGAVAFIPLILSAPSAEYIFSKYDTSPLPVVVLLICETFEFGSPNAYDATVMAAEMKAIIVTVNFRLGALGFLSTGDLQATGNYAMLDQIASLIWVQENIASFGGDPKKVTLMGHGFGAAMVNLLMLTSVAKGLFHNVILQSGSALSPTTIVPNPLHFTLELARKVNCSAHRDSIASMVQCLRVLPFQRLLTASVPASPYLSAFGPTLNPGSFLARNIRRLLTDQTLDQNSAIRHVNILAGFSHWEGASNLPERFKEEVTAEELEGEIKSLVENLYPNHRHAVYDILLHQYRTWDGRNHEIDNRNSLSELLGDSLHVIPLYEFIRLRSSLDHTHKIQNPVRSYLYCFNYTSQTHSTPSTTASLTPSLGDDLIYILGAPLSDGVDPYPGLYSHTDKLFSEMIMRYWANFIRTGNPNVAHDSGELDKKGKVKTILPHWPAFDPNTRQFLEIDLSPTVRRNYRASKVALWLNLLPKIHTFPIQPKYSCLHSVTHNMTSSDSNHNNQSECLTENFDPPIPLDSFKSNTTNSQGTVARSPGDPGPNIPRPPSRSKLFAASTTVISPMFRVPQKLPDNTMMQADDETVIINKSNQSRTGMDYSKYLLTVSISGGLVLLVNISVLVMCVYLRRVTLRRRKRELREAEEVKEEELKLYRGEYKPVSISSDVMSSPECTHSTSGTHGTSGTHSIPGTHGTLFTRNTSGIHDTSGTHGTFGTGTNGGVPIMYAPSPSSSRHCYAISTSSTRTTVT